MTARLSAITAIRLTSAGADRLARFYAAIGFQVGDAAPIPRAELALMGLAGGGMRTPMRIGACRIDLDQFDVPGRAYPEDSTAADLGFQHFAIVTSDAAAAWGRARASGAAPISRDGAVTLPPSSGGVTAVKFRDPEGHPLEYLQFPPDRRPDRASRGMQGVDHTAISVCDIDISRRFYESLGVVAGAGSVNRGPAQSALDGLDEPELDVLAIEPAAPKPHLELLCYRRPRPREAEEMRANDVAATRTVWAADRTALLRDPDGHLHLLTR